MVRLKYLSIIISLVLFMSSCSIGNDDQSDLQDQTAQIDQSDETDQTEPLVNKLYKLPQEKQRFYTDERNIEVTFDSIDGVKTGIVKVGKLDGESVVIKGDPDSRGYNLAISNDGKTGVIWTEKGMWMVSADNGETKKITDDCYNNKTFVEITADIFSKYGEGSYIFWNNDPKLNYDGSRIAYVTNRDTWQTGGYSIWIYNNDTKEEHTLVQSNSRIYYSIVGWIGRERFIFREMMNSASDRFYICDTSGDVDELHLNGNHPEILHAYTINGIITNESVPKALIAYLPDIDNPSEIIITSINESSITDALAKIDLDGSIRMPSAGFSPSAKMYAIFYAPDDEGTTQRVCVVDIDKRIWVSIGKADLIEEEIQLISDICWDDDNKLVIRTNRDDTVSTWIYEIYDIQEIPSNRSAAVKSMGTENQFTDTKSFTFNFDGIDTTLVFNYTGTPGSEKLQHNQDMAAFVTPIPFSMDYLLQYKNSIYYIDMAGNMIRKILNAFYQDTDREELFEYVLKHDMPGLTWGERPIVHQNGKVFAFITNRSGILDKTRNTEVWIKNLETNVEKPVFVNGYEIQCWDGQDGLYILVFDELIKIDTKNCTHVVVKSGVSLSSRAAYPFFVNPTDHGVIVTDLRTGKDYDISNGDINNPEAPFCGNNNYLVCLNRSEWNGFKTNLLIVNLSDMTHTLWNPPDNYRVDDFVFSESGEEVFVNLTEIGNITNKKTVVVKLK